MQIRWTKTAINNLEQAWAYISKENPTATTNTILRIVKAIEILAEHPAAGRPGRVIGTRELIISGTPFNCSLSGERKLYRNLARLSFCNAMA